MRGPMQVGERPAQAVLDGAIGLALATGVPLRLRGPLRDADLALALAAMKLGGDADAAREPLSGTGEVEVTLPHPRAGVHVLDLPYPGAVARALWTLSWPLALLGKPSELRLHGPNHSDDAPTFHDLRLGWAPFAAQFGLKMALELTHAGFGSDEGEIVAALDPAPALTPLRAVHRGLLRQVSVVAAVGGGRNEAAQDAAGRGLSGRWWPGPRVRRAWWWWRRRHDRAPLRGRLRPDPLRRPRDGRHRCAVVSRRRRHPRRYHRRDRRSLAEQGPQAGPARGPRALARIHRPARPERAERADRSAGGIEGASGDHHRAHR